VTSPGSTRSRQRVERITAALWGKYGDETLEARTRLRSDPLDSLVKTILSQNTSDVNSDRAFARLKERFPTWPEALAADVGDVEEAIRIGGLANIKAPRILELLASIKAAHGALDLGALADLRTDEAEAQLLHYHGVGRKTAACVLLFALQRPAFPVDTHCLRIARRLRLVPPACSADRAHDVLDGVVPDELKLRLHVSMVIHGRRRCRPTSPSCEGCPIRRWCAYPKVA